MLSDDLKSLLEKLQTYRATGVWLERAAIANACAILEAAIADAETMQSLTPRFPCLREVQRHPKAGVVDFAEAKAQRKIRDWLEQQGVTVLPPESGPGGAA